MDSDFVSNHDCVGRAWMSRPRRWFVDLVCKLTGHLLWRVMGSIADAPDYSIPLYATYCRRCFKGGYVKADFRP